MCTDWSPSLLSATRATTSDPFAAPGHGRFDYPRALWGEEKRYPTESRRRLRRRREGDRARTELVDGLMPGLISAAGWLRNQTLLILGPALVTRRVPRQSAITNDHISTTSVVNRDGPMLSSTHPRDLSGPGAVAGLRGCHDVQQERILERDIPRKRDWGCVGGERRPSRLWVPLRVLTRRSYAGRIGFDISLDSSPLESIAAARGKGGPVRSILSGCRESNSRQGDLPRGFALDRNLDDIRLCKRRILLTLKCCKISRRAGP
jgi:hypothetical protein